MAEEVKGDVDGGEGLTKDLPSPSDQKKPRRSFLSRLWHGIFSRRGEDFEKKLEHLTKEEAAVHARMKRRKSWWRKMARNIIVLSVLFEVVAISYAVLATRMPDLNWKIRAVRVLPMFILPALSSAVYSMLSSLTRMLDRKDQKMLKRLRTERQEKIDELKERTNFYTTQQLIQRYDLDPAAKAAAATILASKLGADSGLKVYLGDDSPSALPREGSGGELAQSDGLRNRKQPHSRDQNINSTTTQQLTRGMSTEVIPGGQEIPDQTQRVFEHYKGPGAADGGWIARIAAMLVGEDPTQCYALICGNCHMHNGLSRKEDFPYITYYCPHCHALNGSRQPLEHDSGSSSGKITPPAPADNNTIARNFSNASSVADSEVTSSLLAAPQEPGEVGKQEK